MEKYEELINRLTEEFKNTLPEKGEDNFELIGLFKKCLSNTVTYILEDEEEESKITDKGMERILISRADGITRLDIDRKRARLIRDPMIEKMQNVSNKIFREAVKKLRGEEISKVFEEDNKESITDKLKTVLSQVKPFNEEEAKQLYSETVLDIGYLMGEGEITSLRLSHVKKDMGKGEK